mgnify:CR=1 FL=1
MATDRQYLLDTNILVYGFDANEPRKQEQALEVIDRVGRKRTGTLSVQTLSEFANVALYRLEEPLPPDEVADQLELYSETFPILSLTTFVSIEAVRGVRDHSFSYFDAQIWAVARLNQVSVVLSEDFPSGATVEGVTFIDPFSPDFRLDDL